jgi:ABC-type sugar transport system substrate-binding protein
LKQASIAIIAPLQPEDFFDLLWQGVWEATFDLAPFGIQVRNLPTERYDVSEQQEILRQLLEDPVDGIAIVPAHSQALNSLVDEHEARGTPVVTFHGDLPESRRTAFVGSDPFQGGVLAGELLTKFMRGKGRVLSFPGSLERYHVGERARGFRAELAEHLECIVVSLAIPDLEPLSGYSAEFLAMLREADGVYVGDEDLLRIAIALEAADSRAACVGFGNTEPLHPFLARQTVSAVINEQRYQQGYFAVQKAYEAVLKRAKGAAISGIRIPSDVAMAANAPESRDSLHAALSCCSASAPRRCARTNNGWKRPTRNC